MAGGNAVRKPLTSFFIKDIINLNTKERGTEKEDESKTEQIHKLRQAPLGGHPECVRDLNFARVGNDKSDKESDLSDEELSDTDQNDFADSHQSFGGSSRIGIEGRRKYPRERTTFTAAQLKFLEELFKMKKYLTLIERSKVASHLELSEKQVKTWFQNRRTKYRRQKQGFGNCAYSTHPSYVCYEINHGGTCQVPSTPWVFSSPICLQNVRQSIQKRDMSFHPYIPRPEGCNALISRMYPSTQ